MIVRAILTKKIDTLNKRIFRLTLQGYNSPYDSLLCKVNSKSLYKRRLQTLLIILYKSLLFTHFRGYLRDLFSVRSTSYSLRDNYVFFSTVCKKYTTYGLHSFSYIVSKLWKSLPADSCRTSDFYDFKRNILQ